MHKIKKRGGKKSKEKVVPLSFGLVYFSDSRKTSFYHVIRPLAASLSLTRFPLPSHTYDPCPSFPPCLPVSWRHHRHAWWTLAGWPAVWNTTSLRQLLLCRVVQACVWCCILELTTHRVVFPSIRAVLGFSGRCSSAPTPPPHPTQVGLLAASLEAENFGKKRCGWFGGWVADVLFS